MPYVILIRSAPQPLVVLVYVSGINILVVVEKEVLDGMVEVRSALSRLSQQVHNGLATFMWTMS